MGAAKPKTEELTLTLRRVRPAQLCCTKESTNFTIVSPTRTKGHTITDLEMGKVKI